MSVSFSKEQKDLLSQKIIAIVSVMTPSGFPPRRKDEFQDYKEVLSLIFDRYVNPSDKEKGMTNNLANKNRILVEINPVKVIYPTAM